MGEPIADPSNDRLNRQIQRARSNTMTRMMYGETNLDELVRRIRMAARSGRPYVDGTVIYDVEPIEFDDLIEVRTGGDRSVMAALRSIPAGNAELQWVSFWPLASMDAEAILGGWEEALRTHQDTIHDVCVEVGSVLESTLTFDFGYVAWLQDQGALRRMTSPRFIEELREARRQPVPAVVAPRRRSSLYEPVDEEYVINGATSANTSARWVIDQEITSQTRNLINPLIRPDDPPMPADVDVDGMDEVWVADYVTDSDDGGRVWVNEYGLDTAGYDPRGSGYRVGYCNCDDCRQVRIDEAEDDVPEDYYDHEEDEG